METNNINDWLNAANNFTTIDINSEEFAASTQNPPVSWPWTQADDLLENDVAAAHINRIENMDHPATTDTTASEPQTSSVTQVITPENQVIDIKLDAPVDSLTNLTEILNNAIEQHMETTETSSPAPEAKIYASLDKLYRQYRSLSYTDEYKVNPFNPNQKENQFLNQQADCYLLAKELSDSCTGKLSQFLGEEINVCCGSQVELKEYDVRGEKIRLMNFEPSTSLLADIDVDDESNLTSNYFINRFTIRPLKGNCSHSVYQYVHENEIIPIPMVTSALNLVYHLPDDSLKIPACLHKLIIPKNFQTIGELRTVEMLNEDTFVWDLITNQLPEELPQNLEVRKIQTTEANSIDTTTKPSQTATPNQVPVTTTTTKIPTEKPTVPVVDKVKYSPNIKAYIKTTGQACINPRTTNVFEINQDTEDNPANLSECSNSWIENVLPNYSVQYDHGLSLYRVVFLGNFFFANFWSFIVEFCDFLG